MTACTLWPWAPTRSSPTADPRALHAVIQAILRRIRATGKKTLRLGELSLSLTTGEACFRDKRLELTRHEFAVLELLLRTRGTILTSAAFLRHLDAAGGEPDRSQVDPLLCGLGKKSTGPVPDSDHRGLAPRLHDRRTGRAAPPRRHIRHAPTPRSGSLTGQRPAALRQRWQISAAARQQSCRAEHQLRACSTAQLKRLLPNKP
jgi:hypothetical protein